jgi:hypothetical protein
MVSSAGLILFNSHFCSGLSCHGATTTRTVPSSSPVAALALFLLWRYRTNFAGLLKP